jgi:hypothetical protein
MEGRRTAPWESARSAKLNGSSAGALRQPGAPTTPLFAAGAVIGRVFWEQAVEALRHLSKIPLPVREIGQVLSIQRDPRPLERADHFPAKKSSFENTTEYCSNMPCCVTSLTPACSNVSGGSTTAGQHAGWKQ